MKNINYLSGQLEQFQTRLIQSGLLTKAISCISCSFFYFINFTRSMMKEITWENIRTRIGKIITA